MEDIALNEENKRGRMQVGTILIAEDDPDYRQLLSRRASRMGLEVHQAADGLQAMEALKEHKFDALVLDLYMPEHTGLEVIDAARKIDPDIQALILTGSASVETAVEALRAGVYDYLTKPLESMTSFELALSRALERRYLVNENKRLFEEIQRLAVTDSLTGLYNRHKLQDSLNTEVERAKRYNRPLSIIMVDMDELKVINDTYGHAAGDEALKVVAKSIERSIRKVDLGTRFGGDEFIVLLPEADREEAASVAKRIRETIMEMEFESGKLSVSMGVVQWHEGFDTPKDFVHAVDEAMYLAKRSEGERLHVLTSEAQGPVE
ncbi:MAG: diguanylate cyclase [Anaerolineales bacterium]|nr:diguanylate cyclase [Anaerolineales bacterium]